MERQPERALRVLVIDDEWPIRLLCRVNLQAEGMEVVEAATAAEGVTLAHAIRPDAAIVDLMLPDGDGWSVASEVRADPATAKTALLILTAMSGPDLRPRAERLDALLLGKPFDPLALPQIIRRACEER